MAKPTTEEIKKFTQEQVNALPNWYELDKIEAGKFAKHGWLKAPASLVYIISAEPYKVCWAWADKFTGEVDLTNGNVSNVYEVDHQTWGKIYRVTSTNTHNLSHLVK